MAEDHRAIEMTNTSFQARDFWTLVVMDGCYGFLGGGNSNISLFSPIFGEDSHFDSYFSDGWFNHQAVFFAGSRLLFFSNHRTSKS